MHRVAVFLARVTSRRKIPRNRSSRHRGMGKKRRETSFLRTKRSMSSPGSVHEEHVRKGHGGHGPENGNHPGNGADVMAAANGNGLFVALAVNGLLFFGNGRNGLDGCLNNDILSARYPGQDAARIIGKKSLGRERIVV